MTQSKEPVSGCGGGVKGFGLSGDPPPLSWSRRPRQGRIVTGAQIRAGRALLGATRRQIAEAAGLHYKAVMYWEKRKNIPAPPEGDTPHACRRIAEAFRLNGVLLTNEPGPGVALAPPQPPLEVEALAREVDQLCSRIIP